MSIVPYIQALWPVPSCVNLTTYVQGCSDYEVICQILQKLNETIHSFNTLDDAVTELSNKYDSLKDYVDAENAELKKYVDDKFNDVNIEQFIDNVLSQHPEWVTTVQDNSLTPEKFTEQTKLETLNNYVTPQMYGAAGDGVTDDTTAFQNALNACYNAQNVLYIPEGRYRINSTLHVYQYTTVNGSNFGRGAVILCPDTIGTLFSLEENESQYGYCEHITFNNLRIEFNEYSADTTAFSGQRCPYINVSNVSMANVGSGFVLTDTWMTRFSDCYVGVCNTGFKISPNGTSTIFDRCYVNAANGNAFDISGLVYSSMQSCGVDGCKGIAYNLLYSSMSLVSCGCESAEASACLVFTNSQIEMSGCSFRPPKTVYIRGGGGTVNAYNCIFGTSSEESAATLFNIGSADRLITVNGGRLFCRLPASDTTVRSCVIIQTVDVFRVYGSGVKSGSISNINRIRYPTINVPCYGNIYNTDYGTMEYGQAGVGGDIVPNANPSNGVAMYVQTTTNNILVTNITVTAISGNTLTLSSDSFPNSVTELSASLTDFSFVKQVDNSTTNIASLSGVYMTLDDVSGILIGDCVMLQLKSNAPTFVRDCKFGPVPYIQIGDTPSRPANQITGVQYFDTTLSKPIWWTGSKWVDSSGTDA